MLVLFMLSLLIGYIYGQDDCPGWDLNTFPCPDGCEECCNGEGCVLSDGEVPDEPGTTENCDDDDDAHNWDIDFIGSSTQFRLYDPCDNKFIKIKMEDITEYDASDDSKTGNKETSFASSDWDWNNPNGVYSSYGGANSIFNQFVATELTKMSATFTLTTIFFREDAVIKVDNVTNKTISQNNMKFNVEIENWDYESDGNYIVLCIGIMTNKAGDVDNDPSTGNYYLDSPGFEIDNDPTAKCDSNDDIDVSLEQTGNGNNHLDLCYTFEHCQSGHITYDPIIKITQGSAKSAHYIGAILFISFISMLL